MNCHGIYAVDVQKEVNLALAPYCLVKSDIEWCLNPNLSEVPIYGA